jgi:hypothetical protein
MKQLHKRFSGQQVKDLLKKYEEARIERATAEQVLGIKKAQFFRLLSKYRRNAEEFSIEYGRDWANRVSDEKTNELIRMELEQDMQYIKQADVPIWRYNYSEIGRELLRKYGLDISTQTIIDLFPNSEFKIVYSSY